jgi:23S rRNA (pseudouridine1915-N3)-methyltransferase
MLKIFIFSHGKVRESFIKEAENEYIKRASKGYSIEIIEKNADILCIKKHSSHQIIVALDEKGIEFSTISLKEHIEMKMVQGISSISFIIGDAYGLSNSIKQQADMLLSLSKLTFPFQLARLLLVEQVYRVMSLIENAPYHK